MKLMPVKDRQTIQNKICRNFGEIMAPLLAHNSAIRQMNDLLMRAMMNNVDNHNMSHYNELNDSDCLPPLIPDEQKDSYELPSIQDKETEEDNSEREFSIRQYEERGGPILSVMKNWTKAVTDPAGNLVKYEGLKPMEIGDTCNDDEYYELPSLVVDDDTY